MGQGTAVPIVSLKPDQSHQVDEQAIRLDVNTYGDELTVNCRNAVFAVNYFTVAVQQC
jgi:hypothetical protein